MTEEVQAQVDEAVVSPIEETQAEELQEAKASESETTSEDLEKEKYTKGVEKRFGVLVKQRNEARADAERYREQIAQLNAITKEQRESLTHAEISKLSAKEALLEDKIESAHARIEKADADEWTEKVSTIEGYSSVVDTALLDKSHPIQGISKGLVDYLKETDGGAQAIMEICKDRELCKKILSVSPLTSVRMIDRLIDSGKLGQTTQTQTEPTKPKIGTTPKPSAVSGGATQTIELHKMTTAQYIEYMNKLEASKKRIY